LADITLEGPADIVGIRRPALLPRPSRDAWYEERRMTKRVALQMDPLGRLNPKTDSTLELARAGAERGHELFCYPPAQLRLDMSESGARVTACGRLLHFQDKAEPFWTQGEPEIKDLSKFDLILMRQEPPFDLAYITATHILEHLQGKVKIINDPVGVRNSPEKLLATHFPHLMPPTLITRDYRAIEEFRQTHGDIIFKPLHGFAGHGIFHIKLDDDNLPALLETVGAINAEPWMIQKYLPEIQTAGDKRIILLDGNPVGSFTRRPASGDARGNMRVGGSPVAAPLTKRDRDICAAVRSELGKRGLFLVGLDVIGDYLTEINVTCPTGLVISDQLEGRKGKERIAEKFWDLAIV
jgi:glutathione synthase